LNSVQIGAETQVKPGAVRQILHRLHLLADGRPRPRKHVYQPVKRKPRFCACGQMLGKRRRLCAWCREKREAARTLHFAALCARSHARRRGL
jgi:hypothetical protein